MASGNLSPRQKMINMMYLVLTALLALNVSKEILDAFVVVNMGLLQQKENLEHKNQSIITDLENQLVVDTANEKLKTIIREATVIKNETERMNLYIEEMKIELVQKVEGVNREKANEMVNIPALVNRKDDYDRPTHFFGTNDPPGKNGKAGELRQRLNEYKETLTTIVDNILNDSSVTEEQRTVLRNSIVSKLSLLNTEDPSSDEEAGSWEMQYFYHLPLSAALTELTKWQNFVKGAETDMLTFLWNETSRLSFKFDKVQAAVIPVSNFVTSGANFEADVFLAAYSTSPTNTPTIIYSSQTDPQTGELIDPVTLPLENVVNGVGKVKLPTNGAGERTFTGRIEMLSPTGELQVYPFSTSYNVAPPSATISPTAMNVFYKGLKNPLSVSVPGVAPNQISVTCSNCQISGSNGNYNVTVTNGRMATISVSAKRPDGSTQLMGRQEYRIKSIPAPTILVAGKPSNSVISASLLSNSAIIPDMSGFVFDNTFARVISYDVFISGANGFSQTGIQGNQLPQRVKTIIRGLPRGSRVYFDNIRILVPPNTYRTSNAVYKIN